MKSTSFIKGRGAQSNSPNRFFKLQYEIRDDFLNYCALEGEAPDNNKTQYLEVFPKSIVNKVTSPDVQMDYSINMYQGCEHGCIYCYARNSHEYWGYSAGLDFERQILVKKNASQLLEVFLKRKSWKACPIVMSGNTDCYQSAERQFEITKKCLEVFLRYKHPVGIITKNALILRDLELLKALAKDNLIKVNISITSLSDDLRRILEPRTATIKKRLNTVKVLSDNGIPVSVNIAPIIPTINSHEVLPLAKTIANHGALGINHTVVRLNGAVAELFTEWIHKTMPDRAEKVLRQIESCHGGNLSNSHFGVRMHGQGPIAKQINDMITLARHKYFKGRVVPKLNTMLHEQFKEGQLKLF